MFELPEVKRVRREDVYNESNGKDGSDDDGGFDAELEKQLNARIAKSLGMDSGYDVAATTATDALRHEDKEEAGGEEDEEYEFRLFRSTAPTAKVSLWDDDAPRGDGAFVRPRRPDAHYFAGRPSSKQRERYAFAAVTGDEVLDRSRATSYGLMLPWKVTTVRVTRKSRPGDTETHIVGEEDGTTGKKKTRVGKKRRIALRTREKAKKVKEEVAAKKLVDKEEHLKEKKKRMNRLKKLRKRAKNKASKQAGEEEDDNGGDKSEDESVVSGD